MLTKQLTNEEIQTFVAPIHITYLKLRKHYTVYEAFNLSFRYHCFHLGPKNRNLVAKAYEELYGTYF